MKPKTIFLILLIAAGAAAGGWWAAKRSSDQHESGDASANSARKIRFYQCPMHPQVKADKPGDCPICGMDLVPVYEGQSGLSENLIALDTNIINVIHVQVETVKRQPLRRTVRVAGTIEDDDTKHRVISAYIDGRIEKLFANYTGAEVTQGEPLATFYSPNLLTAEREYLVVAQGQSTNASPEIQAENKRMLNAAAQRLKRLGLTEDQISALATSDRAALQSKIVAPMSGTITERFVYEGQYVKEGDKLFEIADFSTMWFQFDAYERDLPWLKVGQRIEVTTPSAPGKIYDAKINFIDPNINDPTRSAKVRVEIANPLVEHDGKKRRELFLRIYAEGAVELSFPEALVVSRGAVLNPGGEPNVYIDHGEGVYEPRKIKLGVLGDEGWQVLDGVSEGERVVTSGNLMIDAQAQFNQGGTSAAHHQDERAKESAQEVKALPATTEAHQKIANEFFVVAGRMADALASDDFKQFNEHAAKLHTVLPTLSETFANDVERSKLIEPIESAGHLAKANDLAEARKQFVPFTLATVEFAKTVRNEPAFAQVKIYKCPMANQGVPDAPKNGFWIQTEGPLRNPFFGDAMLTCGSEVKP